MIYPMRWDETVALWDRTLDEATYVSDPTFDPYDEKAQSEAMGWLPPRELAAALRDVRGCDCCVKCGSQFKDAIIERIVTLLEDTEQRNGD